MHNKHSVFFSADRVYREISRPFNVHIWSDHPNVQCLTDDLFEWIGGQSLVGGSNRRPATPYRDQFKTLLLDCYTVTSEGPAMSIMFSRDKNYYSVRSRYNGLNLSHKIIWLQDMLAEHGYLDVCPGYYDRNGLGTSYMTRIRPTKKLRDLFIAYHWDDASIQFDRNRECIILHSSKAPDIPDEFDVVDVQVEGRPKAKKGRPVQLKYTDTDHTQRMRQDLTSYNDLLRRSIIDIPERTFIEWTIRTGKNKGRKRRVSLLRKFVTRVFSRGSWDMNGRFYGGFWQSIPKEFRPFIHINGNPTVELDYKGLHINMLSFEANIPIEGDPYQLDYQILPHVPLEDQRSYVKALSIYAINAKTKESTFKAFRSDMRGLQGPPTTTKDLNNLLDAFLDKHPHLEEFMCTDQGIGLMNKDSTFSESIINHFTDKGIVVLCVHDSYIVEDHHEQELRTIMNQIMMDTYGCTIEVTKKERTWTL